MISVRMCEDEWYPVLTVEATDGHGWGVKAAIPDELFERYKAALEEFNEVQQLLEVVWRKCRS